MVDTFSDVITLYFGGVNYSRPQRLWRKLKHLFESNGARGIRLSREYYMAKERSNALFRDVLTTPSLLSKLEKQDSWSGASLVIPITTEEGKSCSQ